MSRTIFTPQSTQSETSVEKETVVPVETQASISDTTSSTLLGIARWSVVLFAGLLPIAFFPGLWGSLGFQKVLLAFACVGVVVIAVSLLALRTRQSVTVLPISLGFAWLVAGVALVSAVLSPQWLDAFRGSVVETQTALFIVLLAAVMSVGLIMQRAKRHTFLLFMSLMGGAMLLLLYVVLRLVFGPILEFGSFASSTVSPVGNFNDMAVFSGLVILMSVVAMMQLRLTKVFQIVLSVVVVFSLVVLAAVNFFYVWLIIGFFGLLVLLYLVSRDTLFSSESSDDTKKVAYTSQFAIGIATIICVTSGLFVVAGDQVGAFVSNTLNVDYLEVRPSLGATVDIMQATYDKNLYFGAGPNQFVASWRLHKDPSINQTIFWNTDFQAGSGYIPTLFITLGLVGALAIIAFHVWYLWTGVRMLLRPEHTDSFWYFVGLTSFTGAVFLWGISYVYIPSATLLLLAALLTGISCAAGRTLQPQRAFTIPLVVNRQRGFVLMAVAIVCITGTMGTWFTIGKQYVAQSTFAQSDATSTDIAQIDQAALASFDLYPDDSFLAVRARIALLEMNQLLGVVEPTEADQQRFLQVSDRALTFANAAIAQSSTIPSHHVILAGIYNNLAVVGIPDAVGRVTSSIANAQELDPNNPTYALMTAQLAANRGDATSSRQALIDALSKKSNFSQALYLLAQLDIAQGNVDAAIDTTQAIIRLEPNNPTRYYQLGILESANANNARAAEAYRAAISIDPNFANARYLLALLQIADGETDAALASLRIIAETNAENVGLQELIAALELGEVPALNTAEVPQVNETEPVVTGDGVTSPSVPDSDLLTPLNTVSESVDTAEVTDEQDDNSQEPLDTDTEVE